MNYVENIEACERGGHDMSEARTHVTKAAPTHKPEPFMITLDVDEAASAIEEAIARSNAPLQRQNADLRRQNDDLEARVADLETRVAALESAAGAKHHKPVLRVAAGGRRIE